MWIVILVVIGAIIAVMAAAGSASSKKRSNNTYVGTFVHPGKTTYFVTDDTTGKILAKASIRGSSEFYALDKLLLDEEAKMSDCTTAAGMKKHLDIMETAMQRSGHTIPSNERSFYDKMMKDARESYKIQIEDEKHEAFDKKFQKDRNTLEIASADIIDWDFRSCDSGDANKRKLMRIRTKMLDYADQMDIYDYAVSDMAFVLDIPETTIKDEDAFAEYFQPYIDEMKEEGWRKKRLIDKVAKAVPDEGNIKRSDLMRQLESEMEPEELKICYKQAVERKRIHEEKIGSYYYVNKPRKSPPHIDQGEKIGK